jgi:2-methylcitrate dehydratase PrpD
MGALSSLSFADSGASSCSAPAFPDAKGLTAQVAEFVVKTKYSEIPSDVIALGKKSVLDGLGLAICGSVADTWKIYQKYAASWAKEGGATVFGTAVKLPSRFAAFANGLAIHVNDYDDTQLSSAPDRVYGLLTHPTVSVLPPAVTLAEMNHLSGRDLMLAYHVGVEVECKIAEAISPRHYEEGFHTTGTCGVFGSAAACAKLRDFDGKRTAVTFGIAASQSSGLRENFGTDMKPFHAGHSAETGVVSADLAAMGWTGSDRILEAANGFFHAFGGSYEPSLLSGKLGNPWTFASPGISIKPFPSGSLTHPGMTEMLGLIQKNHIKAAEVESVYVGTNHNMPNTLIRHHPTDALQAKFSMEFCMAVLLIEGKAGLNQFTDEVVNRPDIQAMIRRVQFQTDPEAEKAGYDKMTTIIRIKLKDGRTISGRSDFAKGSPQIPMSYDEVADKFRDCAKFANWPDSKAEQVVSLVSRLEDVKDINELTAACSRNS